MAHAEETPNVVEYSMTLAGNTLEKPKQEEASDGDSEDQEAEGEKDSNQENV